MNIATIPVIVNILLFLFCSHMPVCAQVISTEASHKYYLEISGVHSREDVASILQRAESKPGILHCTTNDYPADYFILYCNRIVTEAEFRGWIRDLPFELKQMEGDDPRRTEQMLYRFRKKPSPGNGNSDHR